VVENFTGVGSGKSEMLILVVNHLLILKDHILAIQDTTLYLGVLTEIEKSAKLQSKLTIPGKVLQLIYFRERAILALEGSDY